jgi:hypothetical protein
MSNRHLITLTTGGFAALALAASLAHAETTPSTDAKTPAATTAPAAATEKLAITPERYPAIVGLPVISSDGKTIGQVLSVGPGLNSKSMALSVKPVADLGAKAADVKIPVDRSVLEGRTVQLMVSLDDVKKFYVR